MRFSIIIFCFNEVGNLQRVVADVLTVMDGIAEQYEVILVNDGSTDGTGELCDRLCANNRHVRTIHHPVNLGIGEALRTGYQEARLDYVCAIPGDGQFRITDLLELTPFGTDRFIAYYREETGYNIYRRTLTWLNRAFNQHVLGIFLRDVNWVKVYRREHLEMTRPKLHSSLIETEITAKLAKCHVYPLEIPTSYLQRDYGNAKGGNWRTLRMAIGETYRLWQICTTFKL
ncbi:MAG: glycosyltransferase family 2 protein [Flavobacteriales bacterium]|nr:glycosyltransferase family 2 protein [Flavobacteriales bacterium]